MNFLRIIFRICYYVFLALYWLWIFPGILWFGIGCFFVYDPYLAKDAAEVTIRAAGIYITIYLTLYTLKELFRNLAAPKDIIK